MLNWILLVIVFLAFAIPPFLVKRKRGVGVKFKLEADHTATVMAVGNVPVTAHSSKPFVILSRNVRAESKRFSSDRFISDSVLPPGEWTLVTGDNVYLEVAPVGSVEVKIREGMISKTAGIFAGLIFALLLSIPLWF